MVTVVEDALPNISIGERVVKAKSWARMLDGIIPVLRLRDSLDLAFKNNKTSFPVNHYDLKNAWAEIGENEKKQAAKIVKKITETESVASCKEKHLHIKRDGEEDAGEILHWNWIDQGADLVSPCFVCRSKAYKDWRKRMVEKYPAPAPPNELKNVLEFKKPAAPEVPLSAGEISDLLSEHNSLVRELVADPAARLNLELVFDEGANIFKLPHRADLTFSIDALKRKIGSYRQILAARDSNEQRIGK